MALPVTIADQEEVASRFTQLKELAARLKQNAAATFSEAKPLAEVFDFNSFSRPPSTAEVPGRLRKNVSYFKTNYALLAGGTTVLVMLMNPWSLIVLAVLAAAWGYMYIIRTSPLVLGGREFSDREKFLLMAGSSLVIIFFITSVGATIFYALGLSMIMIGIHAALRVPDDTTLFADEAPASSGGLLDMFKPKNPLAAYAAGV